MTEITEEMKDLLKKINARAYRCKLCGKVFYPRIVNTILTRSGDVHYVVISGKTLLKHHLINDHGLKSLRKLRKRYAERLG